MFRLAIGVIRLQAKEQLNKENNMKRKTTNDEVNEEREMVLCDVTMYCCNVNLKIIM